MPGISPNYTFDIRGIEVRPSGDERFYSSVPEKVSKLADGDALSEVQKSELFWRRAAFPQKTKEMQVCDC